MDTELEVETLKIKQYIVALQKSISLYRLLFIFISQLKFDLKNSSIKIFLVYLVELDVETLVVVGVETLEEVETEEDVDTELDVETLKVKWCIIINCAARVYIYTTILCITLYLQSTLARVSLISKTILPSTKFSLFHN